MSGADTALAAAGEVARPLLQPIAGGAGEDVTYSDELDVIRREIKKINAVTGGKIDWSGVAENAETLLVSKGKDFRVAIYWGFARAHTTGLRGLLEAFVLLDALCAQYWTSMGPQLRRPKTRASVFAWLMERAAKLFSTHEPTLEDGDLLQAIDGVSRSLDALLADKLGAAHGGLFPLGATLRDLLRAVPEPPPPPPPPEPPPPPPEPTAVAPPVPTAATAATSPEPPAAAAVTEVAITDVPSAIEAMEACGRRLVDVASALRAADPADPRTYRILRSAIWLELQAAPPAEGGRTRVPPPPPEVRQGLDGLVVVASWSALAEAAERACAAYPLWLDPHRYTALALDRLGGGFAEARRALVTAIGQMLARVPGLTALAFDDGTPLTDAATTAWLDTEVLPAAMGAPLAGAAAVAIPTAAAPEVSPLDAAAGEARALVAGGDVAGGLRLLTEAAGRLATPALRLRGRLAVAELCVQAEQLTLALAQLEELRREVDGTPVALGTWEPALCADVHAAWYLAQAHLHQGQQPPAEVLESMRASFKRVCQLAPLKALPLLSL